ncbi:MAG: hypothetical protein NT029_08670 [Armatimonadetes bacterium]|nr:hypothetical protein [Armatimonadota bacterium]
MSDRYVNCPKCLYVSAELRGINWRTVCRIALAVILMGILLIEAMLRDYQFLSHIIATAPATLLLLIGSFILPVPWVYCPRCAEERAKARRKKE